MHQKEPTKMPSEWMDGWTGGRKAPPTVFNWNVWVQEDLFSDTSLLLMMWWSIILLGLVDGSETESNDATFELYPLNIHCTTHQHHSSAHLTANEWLEGLIGQVLSGWLSMEGVCEGDTSPSGTIESTWFIPTLPLKLNNRSVSVCP